MLLALLALANTALGVFVAPAEGPVPFGRDKVPLDVATMTKLSRQLVVMAGQVSPGEPEDRRTLAQMMALSLALDPSNNKARELLDGLVEGGEVPRAEERDVEVARSRAWNLLGWLEQPEAGEDGQALGACLSDVLVRADPLHPVAKERVGTGERGKWLGWVAGVDRFRSAGPTDPGGTEPEVAKAKIELREVSCSMPIRYRLERRGEAVIRPVEFRLKARVDDESDRFVFQMPGEDYEVARERSNQELEDFLEARHGALPEGLSMRLYLPEDVRLDYARDGEGLKTLIAVMANAVFSGIAPEGIVLAGLDENGSLVAPHRFWETLRALSEGEGEGRLIVPDSRREDLPPLLTLEKSEFFFRYEVLLAKDLDELLSMSSSQPGEKLVEAMKAFDVVKQARENRSLGSFVAHSSTQQRLGQVVSACPSHASARMLALRGTANWPKRLDDKYYAMEVRAALEPMGDALKSRWEQKRSKSLLDASDECRNRLGPMEKLYGSVSSRTTIYDPAMSTAKSLPALVTDLKRLSEDQGYLAPSLIKKTYLGYIDTLERLTKIAGDSEDYPLPDRERVE
jgi:hypothetical protein